MILRVCVCIPTYNNPKTIASVVLDALEQTQFPVLVVDDGSDVPVLDLLGDPRALAALASQRLRVIRFEKNRGKGSAIQEAFRVAVASSYTHLLTLDGDGQHLVSEASKLIQAVKKDPWSLVIGNRKMQGDTVPKVSRFGRAFSNFWVGFETGTQVVDSQSGYRVYPLFLVQTLEFWTRKFDFEIEVLIRLLWRGVAVQEVEIDVYYPRADERVSHFDKLWDNVRISALNVVLVILSLLKSKQSASSQALALGVGIAVGCTPFYGVHTFIVAGLAVLFRLNGALLFLGSQISIPPLMPFLVLGSMGIGKFLQFGSGFLSWLVGSLILGFVLGSVGGLIFYAFTRSKAKGKANWTGKTRGGALGNAFLRRVLRHFGLVSGYFCLAFIIPYFYLFAPTARRASDEFWKIVDPDLNWFSRQIKIMKHLYRFGQLQMDRVIQSYSTGREFSHVGEGLEYALDSVNGEGGSVLVNSHFGGWDLSLVLLSKEARDENVSKLHMIHYLSNEDRLEQGNGTPARKNVGSILTNGQSLPVLEMREHLVQGRSLALMGDRGSHNQVELVQFFGRLAPMDSLPFRLAELGKCPLYVCFGVKLPSRAYGFYMAPLERPLDEKSHKDVLLFNQVQEYARRLEQQVRLNPEQWSNLFQFWSALPTAPPGLKASRPKNSLIEEVTQFSS